MNFTISHSSKSQFKTEALFIFVPHPFGMGVQERGYAAPSQRYRYGFNGQEKDDGLKGDGNSLDFGARIYDSRLGRSLSLDPLSMRFANLSPLNFSNNSPIWMYDEGGRIVMLYNAEGKLVATISNGKTIIVPGHEKDLILGSYNESKSYLSAHTTIFSDVENDGGILRIEETRSVGGSFTRNQESIKFISGTDINKNGQLEATECVLEAKDGMVNGTIKWNTTLGFEDNQGNLHSPALVLFHELSHARRFMTKINDYFINKANTKDQGDMHSQEEGEAVKETNEVSKKLNNGDGGNGTRKDHLGRGSFSVMGGAISIKKFPEFKMPKLEYQPVKPQIK